MAETKNYDNVRIYGDAESEVWWAPKGTTLPTVMTTDPIAPFWAFGWLGEDGIPLSVSTEVDKFKGMGGVTLRTKVQSTEKSFKVQALEETPGVTGLYFDHGAPVVTGTGAAKVARIDLPEAIGTVEGVAVVKFVDGGVEKWLCCELVQVSERGELPHSASDMTGYEFTLDILGASYFLTNAPAFTEV
ncbi:hypothetical protein SRABI26_02729 [Arthrobacter sp. Bi26]|uniref:phage tail tube protein n=1 Tax=Arthrobacter sp. Bi26 TaxID=2822350 RepID=UPI001DD2166D|nr:hypothetical protein [Arthrobacter sp. Bi26]CAH0234177.1 hypothetical protein SRABI26_02729 [Arthrobacter sp. Bi26]